MVEIQGITYAYPHSSREVLHQVGFTVQPGDRMAQLVLLPVALPQIEECRTLEESVRGSGGFGSTGR